MMRIEIEPFDTLIFRDGKPFGSSEDNWVDSMLFPSLTTIYGALRTIYFSQNPNYFKLANTDKDPTLKLNIKSFFLKDLVNDLFPIPQDLALEKDSSNVVCLKLKKNDLTSNPLKYIFTTNKNIQKKECLIYLPELKKYFRNNLNNIYCRNIDDFILKEPKIGIGLDKNKSVVEESRLYRIGLNRYKKLKFVVDFEGLEIEDSGFLKLGGEGKSAYYKKVEYKNIFSEPDFEKDLFKLYLLTPAIFKNGWIPSFIDSNNLEGLIGNTKIKLVAVANSKPQYIGGWDIINNRPKKMRRVVGAGSVYYFEYEGNKKNIIDKLHLKSISDYLVKEGYGISIIGGLK